MAKKGDIITGAVVGAAALIAPLSYVMVEGAMKSQNKPKVVVKNNKSTTKSKPAQQAELPVFSQHAALGAPSAREVGQIEAGEFGNSDSANATQTDATRTEFQPVELAHAGRDLRVDWFAGRGEPLDADHEEPLAPNVSPSMRAALAEVGLSSKIAEPVAEAAIEPPSAEDLAKADIAQQPEAPATPMKADEELTEEDRKIAAEFDQKVAGNKVQVVSAVETKKTPEAKTDEAKRCKVTYIRPKTMTVNTIEPLLLKVTTKGFPIVLVRPREAGSPWYAQETLPKQGTYVQAKGRFGNANTPEGSPFRVMVAFIPRIEDIPDNGAEIRKLPEDWVLSQETIVTLKRN